MVIRGPRRRDRHPFKVQHFQRHDCMGSPKFDVDERGFQGFEGEESKHQFMDVFGDRIRQESQADSTPVGGPGSHSLSPPSLGGELGHVATGPSFGRDPETSQMEECNQFDEVCERGSNSAGIRTSESSDAVLCGALCHKPRIVAEKAPARHARKVLHVLSASGTHVMSSASCCVFNVDVAPQDSIDTLIRHVNTGRYSFLWCIVPLQRRKWLLFSCLIRSAAAHNIRFLVVHPLISQFWNLCQLDNCYESVFSPCKLGGRSRSHVAVVSDFSEIPWPSDIRVVCRAGQYKACCHSNHRALTPNDLCTTGIVAILWSYIKSTLFFQKTANFARSFSRLQTPT